MSALQDLGEELVGLNKDQLLSIPMDEDLHIAVRDAQRINSHEGRRRQLQFIGKIMRRVDTTAISAALDALRGSSRAQADELHTLERWRERLLSDESALNELAEQYSQVLNPVTLREIRTAIRMAKKERELQKPPRHYRELFQKLKTLITAQK
jgi:ribosome-associated protein